MPPVELCDRRMDEIAAVLTQYDELWPEERAVSFYDHLQAAQGTAKGIKDYTKPWMPANGGGDGESLAAQLGSR